MSGLYRLAGVAALLSAVIIPVQVAVFIAAPPPLQGRRRIGSPCSSAARWSA